MDSVDIEGCKPMEDAQAWARSQTAATRTHVREGVSGDAKELRQVGIRAETAGLLHPIEQLAPGVQVALDALRGSDRALPRGLARAADARAQAFGSKSAQPLPIAEKADVVEDLQPLLNPQSAPAMAHAMNGCARDAEERCDLGIRAQPKARLQDIEQLGLSLSGAGSYGSLHRIRG